MPEPFTGSRPGAQLAAQLVLGSFRGKCCRGPSSRAGLFFCRLGLERVVTTGATLGDKRPSDGKLATQALSEPGDPGQMLFCFQCGSIPHDLTQTAIDAGLWAEGG